MALIQGSYVRRIHPSQTKVIAVRGLWLIIPSFIFVGIAFEFFILYLGLLFFSVCKYIFLCKVSNYIMFVSVVILVLICSVVITGVLSYFSAPIAVMFFFLNCR